MDWIERPRLETVFSRASKAPVVAIEAPAGYGKSTTAEFLTGRCQRVWVSLTAEDRDPLVFLHHLVEGLHQSIGSPGAQRAGDDRGLRAHHLNALSWPETLDRWISAFYSNTPEIVYVVFDDYHQVLHSPVDEVVVRLVERQPENLRIVFTSREHLDFHGWVRLRALGEILGIGQEMLAFDADETERFFRDGFGLRLTATEAQLLSEETEGWPIGLSMTAQHLCDRRKTPEDLLAAMPEGQSAIFEYLGEQVFLHQSAEARRFLLAISCLDELDATVCAAVAASTEEKAAGHLSAFAARGAFCTDEGAGSYRLHHLFGEFLQSQLSHEESVEIHLRAADHFRQTGSLDVSARHATRAGALVDAALAVSRCAESLLAAGRHLTLLDLTAPLDDVLDDFAELLVMRSVALRLTGRYDEAIAAATRAAMVAEDDPRLAFSSGEAEVLVHLDTVNPAGARSVLQRLDAAGLGPVARLRWMRLLAENQVNAGELLAASETLGELSEAGGVDVGPTELRLLVRRGELQRARSLVERGRPRGTESIPHAHREEAALKSWVQALLGRGEAAARAAQEGIERGAELLAPIVECVCWGRLGLAKATGTNPDLQQAREAFQHALEIASDIEVPRFRAEPLIGLAVLSHRLGAPQDTLRYGIEAVEILERVGDRYLAAVARLGAGAAMADQAHPGAVEWLERARMDAVACGDSYVPLISDQWLALLALRSGSEDRFETAMISALDATSTLSLDEIWLSPPWVSIHDRADRRRLLTAACALPAIGDHADYLERRLSASGRPSRNNGRAARSAELLICTLGEFGVSRRGERIEASAWKRRKALELLWLLCANERHGIRREQAIEVLWPDERGDAVGGRFRVALHALQLALEPDRTRGEPTRFVMTSPDRVWLNPETVEVDIDIFRAGARASVHVTGAERLGVALDALDVYQGPFLQDEVYLEWMAPTRSELDSQFRDLALSTAFQLVERGDHAHAAALGRRAIEVDRYHEEAHRVVAAALAASGDRVGAGRILENLRRLLREDLDVAPSWTLESLDRLLSGDH